MQRANLIGKLESKRSLGRSRYRCEDNIKIDVIEKVLERSSLEWICEPVEKDQPLFLVGKAMHILFPYTREFLD